MMPLALANPGEENLIRKVGGSPEVKKHLEDLGFVAGGTATVVATLGGNIIVKIKESRIAAFRRDHLGFVFQDFNLLDTFSLEDNIYLPLVLVGTPYAEMQRRLENLLRNSWASPSC